ncbi:4-(cytidine 5'-diphospho)-2-C-methyl-D-erythritol kinase [Sphingomicrobium sediminis]|uniref:4-diphosphocytidyl-2-C-methyl-D-erythritol kinase n=1 Tax=Sphingomicrobium sediminis TaxID=2950949 RepID=A0A9X2J122_9SPHN|nr:4-(cytidine 5'-diphospho)-2-C-methyl-D-erythritol kinase [Sphingomicrobium sediminis]MCM8556823.1 4-(cytidine 5'-diphospho)-2-C-methyl-D-erythritol kinase [Sphingomicrobium sediminis]
MKRPEDGWLREPAPAKLNLALHVRRRRDDGYHELETLFAFLIEGDMIAARPAERTSLTIGGPFSDGLEAGDDNLVIRAAHALAEAADQELSVELHLDKKLPVASGIGGGSADAAATLRVLTRLWSLDPSLAQQVAPGLGADVPACLLSMTARGEGVGERLNPVAIEGLSGTPVLLVNPGVAVSTAEVFKAWDGQDRGPLGTVWRSGRNDLEMPARALAPEIDNVLRWLGEREGVNLARMSGSGATCFAMFDDADVRNEAAAACPDKWWHLASELR